MSGGRRPSPQRSWVTDYLSEHGPTPLRVLRARLNLPDEAARKLVQRLQHSGSVAVYDRVRMPGCDKPVARYAICSSAAASASLQELLCRGFGRGARFG